MGGNVFKNYLDATDPIYVGRRLKTEDYPSALFAVKTILICLGFDYLTIDFVREKESHGDLDILVYKDSPHSAKILADELVVQGFKVEHNKDIVSVLLLTFQVDFIFVDREVASYSQHYFSWNDLGNLVGRMSKQIGLKHGHDGLYYVQRDNDRILAEHKLSNDYFTVLEILELNVDVFKKGFDTYEDMFIWVSKSPYFNPEKFSFEALNHRNKVRDRKRKVYNMFLLWCKEHTFKQPRVVDDHLNFLSEYFPDLKEKVDQVNLRATTRKLLSEKFNGNIISSLTGLSGKELGSFIAYLKSSYTEDDLLKMDSPSIHKLINDTFKGYSDECI